MHEPPDSTSSRAPAPGDRATDTADWGYRSFFEHAVEGIFRTSPRGRYLEVNPALAALYGFESPSQLMAELTDIGDQLYVDPERREEFARLIARDGVVRNFVSEIRRRDGARIWISEHARAVRDDRGRLVHYEGTVEDITARVRAERALRESEERYRTLVEAAHNPIVIWGLDGVARYANPAARRMFGFDADGRGPGFGDLDPPGTEGRFQRFWMGTEVTARQERRVRTAGATAEVIETLTLVRREGKPESVVAEYHDLSGLREAHRRLRDAETTSALTGLPNRVGFIERLRDAVAAAHERHSGLGVVVVDLDRFKLVNDSLGAAAGDDALREVASRLRSLAGSHEPAVTIGQLEGDEFALLIEARPGKPAEDTARAVAADALECIGEAMLVAGQPLVLVGSAGVALFPEHATQGDDLLGRAERAMQRAKEQGGGRVVLGTAAEERAHERLVAEYELRRATESLAFALHYQPVLDVASGRLRSVEALIRWPHETRGLVPPGEFVPLLDELGLMEQVTYWVLDEACRQVAHWRRSGLSVDVAVNLPPRLAEDARFAPTARGIVAGRGLQPRHVEFEVTESAAMERPEKALVGLAALREEGFRIAIDDFGVGHSSFARLRQLPATRIKIDRSLVAGVDTDPESLAILRGLVVMAHSAGLEALAEGVETLGEFDAVVAAGASFVQGYVISRPAAPERIPGLLARHPGARRAA